MISAGMSRVESRVEAAIMRWVVLWDTACNFNGVILNQSIFNCLITSVSTLTMTRTMITKISINE